MKKSMSKDRLAAFTDAILAIIMTILVLELQKPSELTWAAIWEIKTAFLAFGVSFFGLAVMWADWHREWQDVKAVSNATVWSIVSGLFFISFVPYITGLLASDFTSSVGHILYGATVTMFTFFNSLSYRSLAVIEENKEISDKLKLRSGLLLINSGIMLLSTILSVFVLPYFAMIGIVIISIIFVLPVFRK